jgi:hypothetical protein
LILYSDLYFLLFTFYFLLVLQGIIHKIKDAHLVLADGGREVFQTTVAIVGEVKQDGFLIHIHGCGSVFPAKGIYPLFLLGSQFKNYLFKPSDFPQFPFRSHIKIYFATNINRKLIHKKFRRKRCLITENKPGYSVFDVPDGTKN